jgi:lipid-binding SYLF domain-containing protein
MEKRRLPEAAVTVSPIRRMWNKEARAPAPGEIPCNSMQHDAADGSGLDSDDYKGRNEKMKKRTHARLISLACLALIVGVLPLSAAAATDKEIDVSVDVAMERFVKEVKGAHEFLQAAKGVLILPKVMQAGFVVGGEYGEGALRIGGKTVDYYNMVSGSFGWQIGAQQKDVILVFMTHKALQEFRTGENWRAGVDGTVTLIKVGAEGSIDTTTIKQPIVGFVFGQKGLMAGVSLEGSKFTKLKR